MKVKPLGNKVCIRRIVNEEKKGGIILPASDEKKSEGEVIAVGPGKIDDEGNKCEMIVQVGDKVIFSQYGGVEYTLNDEEILILSEDEILAIKE